MLTLHTNNIGDIAVIECEGGIVQAEGAFKLRQAVMSQLNARTIVLDLTHLHAIDAGLGVLWFLRNWAQDHDIKLKLFNPTYPVKNRLEHNNSMLEFNFDIATLKEVMALLGAADEQYALAS